MSIEKDILQILNDNYDIAFDQVKFYRDGGSISYIVFAGDSRYFLRVTRPELYETTLNSIDIHLFLQRNYFSVPTILITKQEKPYVKEEPNKLYVLYEYLEGEEPNANDVEKVGELVGKLHNIMESYPRQLNKQDKEFFIDRYIEILVKKKYSKTELYQEYGNKLWEKVKELPRGYCHCDLYIGNILKTKEGKLYVLDFDTSCHGFPMYDITLFCNQTDYFQYSDEGFEKSRVWLERFFQGYLKRAVLTQEEKNAFYYFIPIYHYQLQATIVEIYGMDCNEDGFEDKQLEWIQKWLAKTKLEIGLEI